MVKRIFNWTFPEIIKFLKDNNFVYSHAKGSHHYYTGHKEKQPRIVCVPFHGSKTLKPRTFKGIVRQSGIPLDTWLNN